MSGNWIVTVSLFFVLIRQQSFPRFHNNLRTSGEDAQRSDLENKSEKPPALKHTTALSTTTDEEEEQRLYFDQFLPIFLVSRKPCPGYACNKMVIIEGVAQNKKPPWRFYRWTTDGGFSGGLKKTFLAVMTSMFVIVTTFMFVVVMENECGTETGVKLTSSCQVF